MASPDELAAIFASAWTAGAGSRLSSEHVARLGSLWDEARRNHPDLGAREFATALAELAPGADGLASFLGDRKVASSAALAATLARGSAIGAIGSQRLLGTEDTVAPDIAASGRKAPERYRLIRQLGAGAMGVVWEAEDKQLHRRVALKWVTPGAATDKGYRTRLFREARALAQLHHPNVLGVFDVGEVGDEVFLALELVDGTTAREWMDAERRAPAELLAAWRQVGAGLAAVHAAGLIHRDIKPENVFVAKDGRVVVGDFGLATGSLGETVATNLTATGAVVGTPLYMPPEQLHGDPATAAGDQFSLCVCLWEALAGKRPFDSTSIAGLAVMMLKAPVIPPGVDRAVFAVLQRGLAPEAAERWPSVTALLAALEPARAAKRRSGTIAIIGALAVGAVGAVALQQAMKSKDSPPAATAPESATAPGSGTASGTGSAAGTAPATGTATAPAIGTGTAPAIGTAAAITPATATGSGTAPPIATRSGAAIGRPVSAKPPTGKLVAATGPVAPALSSQSGKPTWRQHYDDSIDALGAHNGKLCVQLLADIDTWPPDASREADMSRSMLGSCMMAAGDCAGGRAAIEKYGISHHLDAAAIAKRVSEKDAEWCPLEAPPESAWPARAARRIEKHLNNRSSCKVELDFIAAKKLVIAPPIPGNQMMSCLVADHRCDEAHEVFYAYVRNGGPALSADMKEKVDKNFFAINPSCVEP